MSQNQIIMVRKGKGWPPKPDTKPLKEPEGASKDVPIDDDGSDDKSQTQEHKGLLTEDTTAETTPERLDGADGEDELHASDVMVEKSVNENFPSCFDFTIRCFVFLYVPLPWPPLFTYQITPFSHLQ